MNKSKFLIAMLLGASISACSTVSSEASHVSEFDIDWLKTEVEGGRLWVFEEGSEELAFSKNMASQQNSLLTLAQVQTA